MEVAQISPQSVLSQATRPLKSGINAPKLNAVKTGTTIVGCICYAANTVVLGADTRATMGNIIADKNCQKIHYIAPNIYCCGAGTAADTEAVTQMISSNLKLFRLNSGRESRVDQACVLLKRHLFPYQGHVSAALVLGGVDFYGPHLYEIWPHGSTDSLDYVTMGSGSLAAMAMFETRYKKDMSLEECKHLVHDAVCGGIFNDEGSGSNVDLVVLEKGKPVQILRNMDRPNLRLFKKDYSFAPDNTEIIREQIQIFDQPPPEFSKVVESGASVPIVVE
nr:proteasome subunit beta type-7-B [Paratrimastix eleionoma]